MTKPEDQARTGSDEISPRKMPRTGLWSLLALTLWGPDIFISYRRSNGAQSYAAALRRQLEARGFRCFLDEVLNPIGQQVENYKRAARRSRMFVLVGTASIFSSRHIPIELKTYWESHHGWFSRRWRRILPINVAGALDSLADPASIDQWRGTPWEPLVGLVSEPETAVAVGTAVPSTSVVDHIKQSYSLVRSAVLLLLSSLLIANAILGATLYYRASSLEKLAKTQGQLTRAQDELTTTQGQITLVQDDLKRTNDKVTQREVRLAQLGRELLVANESVEASTQRAQKADARRVTAEVRAEEAEEQRRITEIEVREAVAEGFVASGHANIERDPATAINLAFAAAKLTDSITPADLFREAILLNPAWYRHVSAVMDPNALYPEPPLTFPNDQIATDREISVLLANLRTGGGDEISELGLLRIPTGEILSRRKLEPDEYVLTPRPLSTRLVAISRGNREEAQVFDLEGKGLALPVLETGPFRGIVFSGGSWPCFVLAPDGTIDRHDEPDHDKKPRRQLLGKWPGAHAVFAHPRGLSLVVAKVDAITWIAFGRDGNIEKTADIPWPRRLPMFNFGEEPELEIQWGPSDDQFLTAARLPRLTIYAVHASSGRLQELYRAESPYGVGPPIFAAAREGSRFIVGVDAPDEDERIEVFDVLWGTATETAAAEAHRIAEWVVNQASSTSSSLQTAIISPNGNYVVVSRSLRRGDNYIGLLEIWDPKVGVAVELKTGWRPIVRLAYSTDSSRLLAWEDSRNSHVFRLPRGPLGFPSEDIAVRLGAKSESMELAGRFRKVIYSPQDIRYYDLVSGREVRLQEWTKGKDILADRLDEGVLRIVTESELLEIHDGFLVRRIEVGSQVARATLDNDVGLLQVGRDLRILAPLSLDVIGSVAFTATVEPILFWGDYQGAELWVYALLSDRTFIAWQLSPGEASGRLRELSQVSIRLKEKDFSLSHEKRGDEAKGLSFMRRMTAGDIAIFFTKTEGEKGTMRFHDLIHNREIFFDPPLGWDWPSNIADLKQLIRINNDRLMLIFRDQKKWGLVAAIWHKTGGRCLSAVALERSGEILQYFSRAPDGIHLLVQNYKELARVRTSDGKVLWRSEDKRHKIVPPLLAQDEEGRWQALDTRQYNKVVQRIYMGGMSSARDVTYVEMPESYRKRMARLKELGISPLENSP